MRLFFAVELPAEVRGRIARFAGQFSGPDVALVKEGQLHLTVAFLGEVAEPGVPELAGRARGLQLPAPFSFRLQGAGSFSQNTLWIGVGTGTEQVKRLMGIFRQAFSIAGAEKELIPHVTFGRVKSGRERVKGLLAGGAGLVFGEVPAKEVVLMKSTLTAAGPEYETVAAVPLGSG